MKTGGVAGSAALDGATLGPWPRAELGGGELQRVDPVFEPTQATAA